jgi:hypothetical protein
MTSRRDRRTPRPWAALAPLALALAGAPAGAAPAASLSQADDAGGQLGPSGDRAALRDELESARRDLTQANKRLEQATAAYARMRNDHWPSGKAAAAIIKERDDARTAQQQAQEHYDALRRRGGL